MLDHEDLKRITHQEELEWYRTVYESVPYSCFILNSVGKIFSVNQFGAQQLGYTVQELIEKPIFDIFGPEEREKLQRVLTRADESLMQLASSEFRQLCRDGSVLWSRLIIRSLPRADSRRVFILFCAGTAEIKHLEEKLRQQEKQFQILADSLVGKVAYVDSQTRYQYVSKQYGEWSKISTKEILGQTIKGFMGALAYTRVQKYVEAALAGENVTYEITWSFNDGSERYLTVNYIPDSNESGEVSGFFVVMQDLTEGKKTEENLQQFNADLERQVHERTAKLEQTLSFDATLKRITDKVRDSLDEEQIFQTVVQELALALQIECCDIALYNLEQQISTVCYEYTTSLPPVQGYQLQMAVFPELYAQLLQGQCLQFCELAPRLIRSLYLRFVILACPISDHESVLGDLWLFRPKCDAFTELEIRMVQQVANQCAIAIRQARLYQTAQAQIEELANLNRVKDDFLSTVSHELRTPLTNMKMAIQMLTIALGQDKTAVQWDKADRYLRILQSECGRETTLINDLLDLQTLELSSQPKVLEQIHLATWLPQVIDPFRERLKSSQQTLQLDIPPILPPLVSDPSGLGRILAELLHNACKYTPAGEQIAVVVRNLPERLQLQVTNTGVEIPTEHLSRIFEKFYRVPSSDPWKQGGTGLGLTLVQKLVVALDGTIRVESACSKTCFTIELPLTL